MQQRRHFAKPTQADLVERGSKAHIPRQDKKTSLGAFCCLGGGARLSRRMHTDSLAAKQNRPGNRGLTPGHREVLPVVQD
jgi:hypothetical protein